LKIDRFAISGYVYFIYAREKALIPVPVCRKKSPYYIFEIYRIWYSFYGRIKE
jgi:hypothetical protein